MNYLAFLLIFCVAGVPMQVFASELAPPDTSSSTSSAVVVDLPVLVEPVPEPEEPSAELLASSSTLEAAPPSETSTSTSESMPSQETDTLTQTTSTEVTLLAETSTSSLLLAPLVSSTTPSPFQETAPTVPTSTTSTICLAMIAPYPLTGPEWIALYGLTPSSSHRILDWSLHDAQGSLGKISTSTPLLWDEASQTTRFQLKSARLNNGGDSVFLKNALGEIHDTFVYTELEKDQRWVRASCDAPWNVWPQPVIEYTNPQTAPLEPLIEAPLPSTEPPTMSLVSEPLPSAQPHIIEEELPSTPSVSQNTPTQNAITITEQRPPPARVATSTALASTKSDGSLTSATKTPSPLTSKTTTKAATAKKTTSVQLAASTRTKKSTTKTSTAKTPSKKSSSVKSSPVLRPTSMSALLQDPSSLNTIRVRITGVVASTPRLVGANKFVLLNNDGRGILVHGKSTQPSPKRGERVELTGVITQNDTGLWLKQQAQDTWKTLPAEDGASVLFPVKSVPLDAPAQEDAWSHVEIEGTVSAIQSTSLDIETVDGFPLRIKLPKLLGYRAGRVEKGDTLRVRGLLDLSGTESVLIPQVVEDISIMERAPLPVSPSVPKDTRPWLPVGVIAGTLSTSEGLRRLRAWRKKRQEQQAFARFLEARDEVAG